MTLAAPAPRIEKRRRQLRQFVRVHVKYSVMWMISSTTVSGAKPKKNASLLLITVIAVTLLGLVGTRKPLPSSPLRILRQE